MNTITTVLDTIAVVPCDSIMIIILLAIASFQNYINDNLITKAIITHSVHVT